MLLSTAGLFQAYKLEREALLNRILVYLQNDPRISSAWLAGSIGRGEDDELSDLDLWLAVKHEHIVPLVKARRACAAQAGDVILLVEAPQNAPAGGGYLAAAYDAPTAPHLVDWYWLPDSADLPSLPVKLLFDRSESDVRPEPVLFTNGADFHETPDPPAHSMSFFWMMLLITAKHIARQSPMMGELAGITVSALRQAADFVNTKAGRDVFSTPDYHDRGETGERLQALRRLAVEMQAMMIKASEMGISTPDKVVPGAFRFLDMIQKSIA